MADLNFQVGQSVMIDGKGQATVLQKVFRGFGTLYSVLLDGVDYEVELAADRLSPVTATDLGSEQTTQVRAPTGRFAPTSAINITDFIQEQTNKNTLTKTVYDINLLRDFLKQPEINETREMQNIPPTELSTYLAKFFISVRKSNGNEYEPNSLRTMMSSFDRQLRRHNYGEYIATGPNFAQVREVLKSKQKLLKREGKGNLPNRADPISDDEVNILWNNQQFGTTTPDSILQTLWFYNTVHFGLRGRAEHHEMFWGDVELKSDTNGHEYLEFCERQSKTRTGSDPRDVRRVTPKMWANTTNPDRCPVNVYKVYAKKRPVGYSLQHHPFYIASTTKPFPADNETWFKRNPVGVNKLGNMMPSVVKKSKISSSKRLSNHSARKYLIQKLSDNNIPPTQIAEISGHKNISSFNNYSHINDEQHRNIGEILHESCQGQPVAMPPNSTTTTFSSASVEHRHSSNQAHITGGIHSIFNAPVYGGSVSINIYQNFSPEQPKRKRLRIIDSDSD